MCFKLLATMLLVGVLTGGCAREEAQEVREPIREDAQEVRELGEQLQIEAEAIQWVANIAEGLKSAQQANKPLLVYFHADWCSWCIRMVRDTYSAGEVIELSRSFVCVQVDTDKDRQVSQEYKVTGLPTIIFLEPGGEVIKRVVGFKNSAELAGIMKEIIEDAGTK